MAKLILRTEDGDQEFSLEESGSLTIGRAPDCDITIADNQASRRHCSVVKLQSGYEVADLGSTNGTVVNATLVKKKKLQHGDVIRIGSVEIVYDDPASAAAGSSGDDIGLLVYARGDRKGETVELREQRTTIGRKQTNTVVLADPVSSSYHCEIVRDLNGYTIRDLGSTNGTLVNGEMITESQLTHGARIRVGNTRFVFQDPAMAEIDLELAAVEDEDDWGMMRDLDLAAVRKRNPATLVYAVLLAGIVGAGVYFMQFYEPPQKEHGPVSPPGNLHDAWSFESPASRFSWRAEPTGSVTIRVGATVVGQGRSALELTSLDAGESAAFYATDFNVSDVRYRLSGKVAARDGATARLGVLWTGLGLRRWAASPPIDSAGLTEVSLLISSPPWANRARLGVEIRGQGSVYLDDVSIVRAGTPEARVVSQNEFRLTVTGGRDVDLSHAGAPVLVNGRLVARDEAGNEVDASGLTLEATAANKDHLLLVIRGGEGAAAVGLEFEEVHGYLTRGGFRAFVPGENETRTFPGAGVLKLAGVRKLLVGPAGRAFAVIAADDEGRLDCEARASGKRRTWTVLGPPAETGFRFRFKTNLRGETREAGERIADAIALFEAGRWGEFQRKAQATLAEFPFASKTARRQLQDLIARARKEFAEKMKRLDREVADYKDFKDLQDLADAMAIMKELREKFQVEPGQGPRGQVLKKYLDEVAGLVSRAREARQSAEAQPLVEQALFIHVPKNEPYAATLLLAYVAWFLPEADVAQQAREELARIEKSHPLAIQVLRRLGLERKE